MAPLVAVLAATALAPIFLRVETGQRFTIVLAHDLPSDQLDPELTRVAEDMRLMLQTACSPDVSVHHIGDTIVLAVAHDDPEENRELVERLLRRFEPGTLRITKVEDGIADIDLR